MSSQRSRRILVPVVIVALFAGSFAGSAWASHKFNDVPDSNPFHDEISAMHDAGIFRAFPDGGFHPTAEVTRQGMAAFLHRGVTRTDGSTAVASFDDTAVHNLVSARITAGAASGSGGFVVVIGTVSFSTSSEASCPCKVGVQLTDGDSATGQRNETLADEASPDGAVYASVTTMFIYSINAGETETYTVRGFRSDSDPATNPTTNMASNIAAFYVPLSGDGDNSLP